MVKQFRNLAFCLALAITPFTVSPVLSHAQSQSELDQRAYQTGYQNGLNAAQSNRPMNMNTDDWHNQRLTIYQQGYQQGYNSVRGRCGAGTRISRRTTRLSSRRHAVSGRGSARL